MPKLISPTRRTILTAMGAMTVTSLTPARLHARSASASKLIIIMLRGAMDGLSAVPKLDDPYLEQHRPSLIPDAPLPLTGGFALHPAFTALHGMVKAGDGAILHAVAGPWRERSHFEAQDLLESGTSSQVARDGWLNRALQKTTEPLSAVSIGPVQPLVLQGPAPSASWSPPILPEASEDTTNRLMDMYKDDLLLGPALARAIEVDSIAGSMRMGGRGAQNYAAPLSAAGRLMAAIDGPDVAFVSLDGWDTHARQMPLLNNRFGNLDKGLGALKKELGDQWQTTKIVIVTEFGRTVRENGAKGSDHGTAGVAFVLGGGLAKTGMPGNVTGSVIGDWPGLAPNALYENRDLAPANDMRGLLKGVLQSQLGIARNDLDNFVFPNSKAISPLII